MKTYHKIQSIFKRDPENKFKTFINEYSLPEFKYLKDNNWVFTEKVDGTNIRLLRENNIHMIRGKTDRADIHGDLFNWTNSHILPQQEKLLEMFPDTDYCMYGEGYGGKIQAGANTYGKKARFVLFDIKVGNWWLERPAIEEIAKELSLDIVPIIGNGTLKDVENICKEGFKSTWGDFNSEGIVARPEIEISARNGQRIITKCKTKDFKTS